jgi:hypothetical protein
MPESGPSLGVFIEYLIYLLFRLVEEVIRLIPSHVGARAA